MVTRPKVKRRNLSTNLSKTGVQVENIYCRKCMQTKSYKEYYLATDYFIDANGYMSICKDCIQKMFDNAYQTEFSICKSLYRLCKILNVKYDPDAAQAYEQSILSNDNNAKIELSFGKYMAKMRTMNRPSKDISEIKDLTFNEPSSPVQGNPLPEDMEMDTKTYLERKWGTNLDFESYNYLEQEYASLSRSHSPDNYPEEILIKEICFMENEIRKERINDKNPINLVKQLQDLMKSSNLAPSQQNAAASAKNLDAFGVWIKNIEEKTPAEWYAEQEKFKDIEGLTKYGEDFITRPLRNFITQSKDFNVSELETIDEVDLEDDE